LRDTRSRDRGRDPNEGDARQQRDRGLGRTRRQHELEQRHGIAQPRLEPTERAVAAPHHECAAFERQETDTRGERTIPTADERAPPDPAERCE
jgi:hypothetical protein